MKDPRNPRGPQRERRRGKTIEPPCALISWIRQLTMSKFRNAGVVALLADLSPSWQTRRLLADCMLRIGRLAAVSEHFMPRQPYDHKNVGHSALGHVRPGKVDKWGRRGSPRSFHAFIRPFPRPKSLKAACAEQVTMTYQHRFRA